MTRMSSRMMAFAGLLGLCFGCVSTAFGVQKDESRWDHLRVMLFQDRTIHDGEEMLALEAPKRAHDAAIVPISIRPAFAQSEDRHIKTITLVIDDNPSPIAGRFHFTPKSGIAAVSTRVRVNSYTNIRAIAETDDGELYMTKRFVKASGGCSAPAGKDMDAAMARIGKMKLRQSEAPVLGEPSPVQFLLSHPNSTGMQMDQLTRHYVPAHFVKRMEVQYRNEPILTIESDISLSEDPSIHFYFVPDEPGELEVKAIDSKDGAWTRSWSISGVGS